jgi:hypothetical protein
MVVALFLLTGVACSRTSDSQPPPTLYVGQIDQHVDCGGLHPDEFHSRGCVVVAYLTIGNPSSVPARVGLCRLDDSRNLNNNPLGPGYWPWPGSMVGQDHDIAPGGTLVIQVIDGLGEEDARGNVLSDAQLRKQARQVHIYRAQCFDESAPVGSPGFPGPWPND